MTTTMPEFRPQTGVPLQIDDGLRLLLAPNPSPMTFWGTNTYLLGRESIVVIDPGPQSDAHLGAIMDAIGGATVSHIIVTHSHLDHSPLARPLAEQTGAPVLAFGDAQSGRSDVMQRLSKTDLVGGGEGVDHSFLPDRTLADGATVATPVGDIVAIHTPGHMGNHICLRWRDVLFSGDHVMGWSTSLVSPPDGDMTDFMASCAKLLRVPDRVYYPAHGAPVFDPHARVRDLVHHRYARTAAIREQLRSPATVASLTAAIYADIAPALIPVAERNVLAHLIDLHQSGEVTATPALSQTATYQLRKK